MRVDMVDPHGAILREIADKRMTRDDVALTYAFCIRQGDGDINYAEINRAIMDRWSRSALAYIKTKAWNLIAEAQREAVERRPASDEDRHE